MSNRLFSDVFYKMLEEYDDGWFSKNCVEDIVIPIDDVAGWFYMTTDERSAIATERILEKERDIPD